MLILSIDCATPVAGVALAGEDRCFYEATANNGLKHSRVLMPMIDAALRFCEKSLDDLDAIAVTTGPGSFTGLRIGLATAKGLAMASGKPLAGIPTLEALAWQVNWQGGLICPLLNARKGEVYAAFYLAGEDIPRPLSGNMALSPEELVRRLKIVMQGLETGEVVMLGDGVEPFRALLEESLGAGLKVPAGPAGLALASSAAALAVRRVKAGRLDDPVALNPVYVRLSEAEVRLGTK